MASAISNQDCGTVSRVTTVRTPRQAGFSLLEVVIAGAVITVGLLAVLGLFGTALGATQSSQMDEIAHARATQTLESIYTARQTSQLTWDSINNTGTVTNGTAGIFTTGLVALSDPGADGLDGTSDDVTPPAPIILPGPDGLLSTVADNQTVSPQRLSTTDSDQPGLGSSHRRPHPHFERSCRNGSVSWAERNRPYL